MTTTLKHLKSNKTPPSMQVPSGLSVAPPVHAIVVNCVSIVDPQLAPIIGKDAEMVMASFEDSQAASPTHGEVIAPGEARPSAPCVAIVYIVPPASHIRSATIEVLAPTTLTEVKDILPEEAMAVRGMKAGLSPALCAHNSPAVS
jgi:hypothetical protein